MPPATTPVEARKHALAGLYDRAAATYGSIGPPLFEHTGRRLVELARLKPGERVLDLGAGRGAVLFPAAERVGTSGSVVGIDLSRQMVRRTAAEIARRGFGWAAVQRMDAEQLAFADATFDVALCSFAIFLFPNVDRALAEARRVLRPGGLLGIARAGASDPRWAWYDQLLRQQPVVLSLGNTTAPRPADLQALIRQAGFAKVRVLTEAFDGVYTDADQWWASLWTHGARTPLERLSPETLARFKSTVLGRARLQSQPDGLHQTWQLVFALARKPLS